VTLSVVMTGAVYHVMLAEVWNPTGLGIAADWGLHTIVPLCVSFGGWPRAKDGADLGRSAGIRALAVRLHGLCAGACQPDGVYPYPFMDPGLQGVERVIAVTLGILGILVLLGGVDHDRDRALRWTR
jgi:hypothetical protein